MRWAHLLEDAVLSQPPPHARAQARTHPFISNVFGLNGKDGMDRWLSFTQMWTCVLQRGTPDDLVHFDPFCSLRGFATANVGLIDCPGATHALADPPLRPPFLRSLRVAETETRRADVEGDP